jgi:hypothetical protein
MSSFAKSKLKAARDAIGKKNYEQAREAAVQVLDYEPDNYTACVLKSDEYVTDLISTVLWAVTFFLVLLSWNSANMRRASK